MCPHCAALGAIAVLTSLPFIKPTIHHYRAKRQAKKQAKEQTDAASEE